MPPNFQAEIERQRAETSQRLNQEQNKMNKNLMEYKDQLARNRCSIEFFFNCNLCNVASNFFEFINLGNSLNTLYKINLVKKDYIMLDIFVNFNYFLYSSYKETLAVQMKQQEELHRKEEEAQARRLATENGELQLSGSLLLFVRHFRLDVR